MRLHVMVLLTFSLTLGLVFSGCSTLRGDLRDDLNDIPPEMRTPTTGGSYPEGGLLEEPVGVDYPYARGGVRRPASANGRFAGEPDSWVDQDNIEANHRDRLRRAPSYRDNPNYYSGAKRQYSGRRMTREDFVDRSESEGSLWASNGQTNYFFVKNKVRSVGDIVTVKTDQELVNNIAIEIKKTLTPPETEVELARAQEKIKAKYLAEKAQRAPATAEQKDPNSLVDDEDEIPEATFKDIELVDVIGIKADETMMAEIVDRYPNGNYKIRAVKRVPYGGGIRMLTMLGVAKAEEINDDEMVEAGKLYEYRLSILR